MKTRFLLLSILLFLLFDTSSPAPARSGGGEPKFVDTILTTSGNSLLLFSFLQHEFSEEILAGISSGIPLQFSFYINLERERSIWLNETVKEMEFKHKITYDTLKETYKVELSEKKHQSFSFKKLAKAQKIMAAINGLEIISLDQLEADSIYKLKFKAVLYEKTLPVWLPIPFVSWWDVETSWHEIEFTY